MNILILKKNQFINAIEVKERDKIYLLHSNFDWVSLEKRVTLTSLEWGFELSVAPWHQCRKTEMSCDPQRSWRDSRKLFSKIRVEIWLKQPGNHNIHSLCWRFSGRVHCIIRINCQRFTHSKQMPCETFENFRCY